MAFDLLGYEASVQQAMSAPWAQSFTMNSDACSPSVFLELSALNKTRFRGLATGLCLRLGGLQRFLKC